MLDICTIYIYVALKDIKLHVLTPDDLDESHCFYLRAVFMMEIYVFVWLTKH